MDKELEAKNFVQFRLTGTATADRARRKFIGEFLSPRRL